jgi:hypothetical protein
MKKLKLSLEELSVVAFSTTEADGDRGTVDGHYVSQRCATFEMTCDLGPAGGSCGVCQPEYLPPETEPIPTGFEVATCLLYATCAGSCVPTCQATCLATCQATCR